jgi:TPP-dependent pyruvate/acetoin dehydrogenase alpha subunit
MNQKVIDLVNPLLYRNNINIDGIESSILVDMLRKMILIRKAEEKIAFHVETGEIRCPCHLGIGQEAVGVAVGLAMRNSDRAFGAHRSHTHYLALNEDTYSLFAEVLGKFSGCSHGMGGSMHIIDNKNGFRGSVPIVGATIPIATGAGLAAKMDKMGDIAVSYFGDGACEEGVLHESLNMASVMNLPVLYVCENNLFSSHLHIDLRQPSNTTARFAEAHKIKNYTVDGNDVVGMYRLLLTEIKEMRNSLRPLYFEAFTYRWRGHVGHREDIDVGVKRGEELNLWKLRDPIQRLLNSMIECKMYTQDEFDNLSNTIQKKINDDWDNAELAPYPPKEFLLSTVYANKV